MNENTTDPRIETIENATPDDGQAGDHLIRESIRTEDGVTHTIRREGIAHHRDKFGNWRTVERGWLTDGQGEGHGVTLTIRRTVHELPTKAETVIERADGHKYITATHDGETWRTREAILGWSGYWNAVWRSGNRTRVAMRAENITPGTWKVEENR